MDSIKFTRLYDNDISDAVRELVEESSYLKSAIFKSFISAEPVRKDIINSYKTFVSTFIKSWEMYANTLADKMKTAKGISGVTTINYMYAKKYIYDKDDYASVLQFADGIISGIKDGKFKSSDDIEDFFVFTVQKAFNEKGDSIAALVDSILINGVTIDMVSNTTEYDAKLFDTVKKYDMFNSRDAKELDKAVDKVIDFICNYRNSIDSSNVKFYISVINNIIEYISYSLAVYATRIYLISQYAYPFINGTSINEIRPIRESVANKIELSESDVEINIMHTASELAARDHTKNKEFINTFDSFIKSIGADSLLGVNKPNTSNIYSFKSSLSGDNVFMSKLMGNSLFEYLVNNMEVESTDNRFTEMNHLLKEFIYNNFHAIETTYTPKHEILHIIRNAGYERTINGYQKLAKDLYIITGVITNSIIGHINYLENWMNREHIYYQYNTSMINECAECIKMLKDLYSELATVFLHKARDIELEFNYLKKSNISKIQNDISVKIPDQKSDLDCDYNMMNAVPDTTRLPLDLLDLYSLPTFESLEMYDDYLRSIPELENDPYLSEATNNSSIINLIMSAIKAAYNRFMNFFTNKQFDAAREWVIKNADNIRSLNYNNDQPITIPNYKKNIEIPPKGFDNLIKNLNAFNKKNVENELTKTEFIKSLYPDGTYEWFYNSGDNSGPDMYRNYILFYDLNEVKKESETINISGNVLKAYVEDWIKSMEGSKQLVDNIKSINNDISRAVEHVKREIVGIDLENNKQNSNNTNPPSMKPNEEGNNNSTSQQSSSNNTSNNTTNNTNETSSGNDKLLNEIQSAINRVYVSLLPLLIKYYLDIYKHIKEAYSIGQKPNQN